MSDYDEADVEAVEKFYEGIRFNVYKRTGKQPWMDQVEEDFRPLLDQYRAAVAPSIAAKARAATVLETADKFERMDIVQFAYWVEESARIARDTTTDRSGT